MCHCGGSFSIPAQQNVTRRVLWVTAKPILTPTVADSIDPRGLAPARAELQHRASSKFDIWDEWRVEGVNVSRNKLRETEVRCTKLAVFIILHLPSIVQNY